MLDEELAWSSTLVERATKVDTNMYKATSNLEEEFIKKRLDEDRAFRAAAKAKAGKAAGRKGRRKMKAPLVVEAKRKPRKRLPGKIPPGSSLPVAILMGSKLCIPWQ